MNLDKQKTQKDPAQKDIEFILNLFNSCQFVDARKEIDRQIINFPNSSILFNILGAVFAGQDKLHIAIKYYKKAIKINPNYAQAHNNLGTALHKLRKKNDAIESYKKAIDLKTDFVEAINNLGNGMKDIGRLKDALEFFEKVIKIKPSFAEAYLGLGDVYSQLANKKKAEENFKKAIEIKPNFADAYNALGNLYYEQVQFDKAKLNFEKAIEANPNNEKFYNNFGILLSQLGKFNEAETLFRQSIKIKSDYTKAYSNMLLNLNYKLDFKQDLYLSEAKKFRLNCGINKKKLSIKYKYKQNPEKLRIGLVSADFGNHPGGYFTLSTLRELKNKNFELLAYSNFDRKDQFANYFRSLFLKWNSIANKEDEEVVEQIINDGVHILIDLQGHSSKNRLPIFFYKPAPLQATWLGQGSTGIIEIDYFIGSKQITPKNEEKNYVEKILKLPEISQCFTPPDFNIEVNSLPAIKNKFVTFGCLNKLCKVNDEVVSLWSKILLSIPKSKLLLKCRDLFDQQVIYNTLKRFGKHNISSDRLILMGKSTTRKEVLEVFNQIDIALDPFPFQGNTSTCEAIWMGVPVLTLKGNRYLFHFGESINSNLKMTNWIAKNYEDYILKAKKFSSDLNGLSKIRANLRQIALRSPVFDSLRFSEHFHQMLWKIWKDFNNK